MVTKRLTCEQVKRLDLRIAAELVNVASRYRSEVSIRHAEGRVHMGSLIGALSVATLAGDLFVLEVNGEDENAAMKAVLRALEAE